MKLPWKKANVSVEEVAEQLARLVQAYAQLPNASKNVVARRIPSFFPKNLNLRKKRIQENNNKALLASKYGTSLNNYRRFSQPRSPLLPRTTRTTRTANRANRSNHSNRSNTLSVSIGSGGRNSNGSSAPNMSETRYSLRSTNNRIAY